MYLWKCWRDTRTAFLVMVGGGVFTAAIGFFLVLNIGGWTTSRDVPELWISTGQILIAVPIFVMPLAGFILGAFGVGEEFGKGSSAFLLTQPRSRRYFLWTNWMVGAAEVIALLLLALALRGLAPVHPAYPGRRLSIFELRDIVMLAVLGLVLYSLTFFFTMVFRSGRLGTNVAFGVVFVYYGVLAWLAINFQIYLPPLGRPGVARYWSGFPWHIITDSLGWVALAVTLVYAAQVLFERAEA